MTTAIRIENIGKCYRLGETHEKTISDQIVRLARRLSGRAAVATSAPEDFWALRDVNLEIIEGEAVGIIGGNGAGKSTLLKILSRITQPTTGRVLVRGRMSSLLEVGTGFHPELTGRDNVFLNGTILGMRKAEVARKFDEIVAFSGVEKFIDTPVKRYSSGMYVRLAFAVAAHLEPDVLVIDEVLSVGDAEFQKRCLGKMGEVASEGRTVIFVSHDMAAIQAITTRCIELKSGRVAFMGSPREAVQRYTSQAADDQGIYRLVDQARVHSGLSRDVELVEGRLTDVRPELAGTVLVFSLRIKQRVRVPKARLGVSIVRSDQLQVGAMFSEYFALEEGQDELTIAVETRALSLGSGTYSLSISVGTGDSVVGNRAFDAVTNVLEFSVERERTAEGTMIGWNPAWGGVDFGLARVCVDP